MHPRNLFAGASAILATVLILLSGCQPEPEASAGAATVERPALQTRADSVAMTLYDSLGGPEAWASLPYLRFDFAGERDGQRTVRNKHLWNRMTGDYRLEWLVGTDSNYVALFNVNTRDGQMYLNGQPVDTTAQANLLQRAYRSFVNDTYWALVPVKTFDEGVTRTYVPDSSNAQYDVIQLSFNNVGLTPGDRYWLYVNKETGQMDRWLMMLQSMDSTAAPRVLQLTNYETFQAPAGPIKISTRKGTPGANTATLTDNVETPQDVPADMFTDPNPRLE
jgi:hypothetical protein